MRLFNTATLHWLWIRFLAGCGRGSIARLPLNLLGYMRWLFLRRKRAVIIQRFERLAELARAAGAAGTLTQVSPQKLTREYFRQRAILGVAPALAASASDAFLESFFSYKQLSDLENAAAEGKGVVIAATHFGSLGISPAVLARRGYRVIILRDQQFAHLLNTRHGKQFFLGAEPLFLDMNTPESVNTALIRCARALREGAVIAYTADARHGTRYRVGTILGRTVQLRTALVELAMRNNSAVVSGFSHVDGHRVQLVLSRPVWLKNEAELKTWCADFCKQWEHQILNHPQAISWHRSDLELLGQPH